MNLEMSQDEIDDLLTEPLAAVLSISAPDLAAPLATPVWFATVEGDLVATTARESAKVRWLQRSSTATVLVQQPLRHVAITVNVAVEEPGDELRRAIASRYVPAEMLDAYLAHTSQADVVLLRMRPIRWRSADLAKAAIS